MEYCQIEYFTLAPELSENISSLKMMGPAETEEIDSLISVSACNTAAVKSKVTFSFLIMTWFHEFCNYDFFFVKLSLFIYSNVLSL